MRIWVSNDTGNCPCRIAHHRGADKLLRVSLILGALLAGEDAKLDRLLEASPTLRMAHQLGRDFDPIAAVESGDEQRVARFVERAIAARRTRRRGWFRPLRPSVLLHTVQKARSSCQARVGRAAPTASRARTTTARADLAWMASAAQPGANIGRPLVFT